MAKAFLLLSLPAALWGCSGDVNNPNTDDPVGHDSGDTGTDPTENVGFVTAESEHVTDAEAGTTKSEACLFNAEDEDGYWSNPAQTNSGQLVELALGKPYDIYAGTFGTNSEFGLLTEDSRGKPLHLDPDNGLLYTADTYPVQITEKDQVVTATFQFALYIDAHTGGSADCYVHEYGYAEDDDGNAIPGTDFGPGETFEVDLETIGNSLESYGNVDFANALPPDSRIDVEGHYVVLHSERDNVETSFGEIDLTTPYDFQFSVPLIAKPAYYDILVCQGGSW